MGREGQQAGGSPGLNAGRGSRSVRGQRWVFRPRRVLPLSFLASPPIAVTHCAGPFPVPSLALPFLPPLSRSCASLCKSVL